MTAVDDHVESGTEPARGRSVGELIVDLVIVVGSAAYLITAQNYPPAGREIPTVVGIIALAVGLLQTVGWFVRPLWNLTHGDPATEKHSLAAAAPVETSTPNGPSTTTSPATSPATDDAAARRTQNRDTAIIVAWAAGFVVAILVLGYRYAVPLFFLAYFGTRKQWKLAVGSAVVMWALTQFVFIDLLGIHLPTSQFFYI